MEYKPLIKFCNISIAVYKFHWAFGRARALFARCSRRAASASTAGMEIRFFWRFLRALLHDRTARHTNRRPHWFCTSVYSNNFDYLWHFWRKQTGDILYSVARNFDCSDILVSVGMRSPITENWIYINKVCSSESRCNFLWPLYRVSVFKC